MHNTTRNRFVGTILAAGLCAAVLPAAANAGVVLVERDGSLNYTGFSGEDNRLELNQPGPSTLQITDSRRLRVGLGCESIDETTARCTGFQRVNLRLGDADDSFRIQSGGSIPIRAEGGAGQDAYLGGQTRQPTQVAWSGGPGTDLASYAGSDRAVSVTKEPAGATANDGRAGFDRDSIADDVERLAGSAFNDTLIGADLPFSSEEFSGLLGNDVMEGRRGFELFEAEVAADGADRFDGGIDGGRVDYSRRFAAVTVTVDENVGLIGDDGAPGEGDNVVNIDAVEGGQGADTLRASRARRGVTLRGGRGGDVITGSPFSDRLVGGQGDDLVFGIAGNDVLFNGDDLNLGNGSGLDDRISDLLDCGVGQDSVTSGSGDTPLGCESRRVGVLRVATARSASVGETHAVRMSWTHPESWRKLRSVELRVLDESGAPVGSAKVRPRSAAMKLDGDVVRTTVEREGRKRISARVVLRPGDALAGKKLSLEVEAIDANGRRQIETPSTRIAVSD